MVGTLQCTLCKNKELERIFNLMQHFKGKNAEQLFRHLNNNNKKQDPKIKIQRIMAANHSASQCPMKSILKVNLPIIVNYIDQLL